MAVSGVPAWGLVFLSAPHPRSCRACCLWATVVRPHPCYPPPAPTPARVPACSPLASCCLPVTRPWLFSVPDPSFLSRAGAAWFPGRLLRQEGVEAAPTPVPSTAAFPVSLCRGISACRAQWQGGPGRWPSLAAAGLLACSCRGGHQLGPTAPTPFPASGSFGPRPGSGRRPGVGWLGRGARSKISTTPWLRACVEEGSWRATAMGSQPTGAGALVRVGLVPP